MSRFFLERSRPWSVLRPGDIVDIVAPASACKRQELAGAVRFLRAQKLVPRYSPQIFLPRPGLFAQTDQERLRQLKAALWAKDSRAIWCVRGGYGCLRLLPELAKLKRPPLTKLVIGYSDITTLHAFLNSQWGWPTLHGPLLDRFGRGDNRPRETRETLGLLFGRRPTVEFANLEPLNAAARRAHTLVSRVVGGNLAVLQSSLGTPWQVLPNKHFLFLEDTGERPHRLDRMLTQLEQAGYFQRAQAVLFGPLLVNQAKDRRLIWSDVIPRFAENLKIPVLAGVPSGHGSIQRPLPLLTRARLSLGRAKATLIVESGAQK